MDNSADQGPAVDNPGLSWGPKPSLLGLGAALTLCAAAGTVWLLTTGDRPGALLFGVFTLAAAAATVYGVLLRPRLQADSDGVYVRTLTGTDHAPWQQVQARVVSTRRLGRDTKTLEIEFDGFGDELHLAVLGWLDLGAEPDDVLDDLNRLRPS